MSDERPNDKETVPPPPVDDDLPEDEQTVMARIPEDLIAELSRKEEAPAGPASSRAAPAAEGGLRQMFARNPMHIRDVLPTEAEGDALLDMLFDDATSVAAPPSVRETEADPEESKPTRAREMVPPPVPAPGGPRPLPRPASYEEEDQESGPEAVAELADLADLGDEALEEDEDDAPTRMRRSSEPPTPRPTPTPDVPVSSDAPPALFGQVSAPPTPPPADVLFAPAQRAFGAEEETFDGPTPASRPPTASGSTEVSGSDADVELEELSPALDSSDLDSSDLGSSDLGSSDLGSSDLAASDLAASDLAASDLAASDLAASDLAASDLAARPLDRAPQDLGLHAMGARDGSDADLDDGELEAIEADGAEDAAQLAAEEAPLAGGAAARPREGMPSLLLRDERDASLVLAEARLRDVYLERAHWLRDEARLLEDRNARASQLLVVSELLAMCGDDDEAAAIASEARESHATAPLVSRQHRAFLAKKGDFTAVLEAVDAETRAMPTPQARCHGSWLGAEIARVIHGDDAGARRRADQAMRVLPGDPRPHVQRVVDALSGRAEHPTPVGKTRPVGAAEIPQLAAIDAACIHLARFRAEPVRGDEGIARTSFESLLDARGALEAGERGATIDALQAVAQGPLEGGLWLAGLLADVDGSTRHRAANAFQAVASGSHGAFARRALAATAIAQGDAVGAHRAAVGDGSFDLADRLALAALAGAPVHTVSRDLEAAANDPDLAPLALAAAGGLPASDAGTRPEIFAVGPPRARAALRLGRRLGALGSLGDPSSGSEGEAASAEATGLREATAALAEHEPGGAAAALGIELDLAELRAADVARALEKWGGGSHGELAQLLAAGLVAEVAGDAEAARGAYERAAAAEVRHEGAVRALASHLEPSEIPGLLAEHAASLDEGPRQAMLFVEAALRLLDLGAETEAETVLGRAIHADASLPFATHLLERQARGRGDRDALLECLRTRREASEDPVERAHDFVREALLISDLEGASPGALLEQALVGQPDDVALRELYERLSSEPPSDRAAWREQRAERASGSEATSLALEAALDFERASDLASAARVIKIATQRSEGAPADGDPLLLPIYAHRYGVAGHGTAELVDALLPQARAAEDPHARREIYERLAELDELGRRDVASGVLWRRTILEEDPGHLPTLRRIETALMRENRVDELEPIALEISRVLSGPESVAHAALAARLRARVAWDETFEAVRIAYRHQPRGPWALRQMAAHARAKGDAATALEVDRQLLERTERPAEIAALALRAARGAAALGDTELSVSLFAQAAKAMPTHLLCRLELAGALEARGDREGAAAQLEAAAECAASSPWKVALDFEAAVLWQDELGDRDRARAALERVVATEPTHEQAFDRLRGIYVAIDARAELAELLERRLDAVTDPAERVEMEVMRGRALAQVGEHASAKRALAAALEASPDHVEALEAFAELCIVDEDWDGAEQALIRLARLAQGPDRQIDAYLRLGDLYDGHLPNPERAELAYGEILKRRPGHAGARERLVALFRREGDFGRAIEEQNVLVASAEQPEDKARRTVELAAIVEAMGDLKKAEATLVAARKAFPKSSVALEALVALYQRTGQQQAGAVLLERAVADARRALGTGRFEGYLFETLAVAAALRGKRDAALACRSVVESLEGVPEGAEPTLVQGAGDRAGDADLDDLVAPDLLSPAFRDLLARTGAMLDTAVPYDPASVRGTPLPPPSASVAVEIRDIALGYGIHRVEILASSVLGSVVVAASAHPPTLVIGHALLATDQVDVRTYLVHRALKVIQSNAAVFSRTAPIDLWPLLAAYLKCFTPGWNPQGVDATRLTNFYGRLSRAVPPGLGHDTGALAAEIIGSIGNRAPTLATAVNGWGDRAALLAIADPGVALTAIAWAGGHTNAPPPPGKDRLVWVGRNAEAREVVLFAVSDAYVEARSRLGLG